MASNLLSELVAVVQWRRPMSAKSGRGWHTMAAFDALRIAEKYRADCVASSAEEPDGDRLEFRVVSIPAGERN